MTALDDIDWASLEHAYGSAEDVPEWLRGLVDPDPAVREESLDEMYGAVCHQGDVYDSTVAAVPYLIEALTTPGLPGRDGIAELLAGIAERPDQDDEYAEQAHALVAAAVPAVQRLIDDPEPAVRAGVLKLLVAVAVPELAGVLLGRLSTESDPAVQAALFEALGELTLDDTALGQLLDLARSPVASTALAALIAVARTDPHRVPLDDAPALIDRAYAETGPKAEPAGFHTGTLIGSVRVIREQDNRGRRAPHCERRVEALTDALGPRVPERIAIVTPLLASPYDDLAGDALFAANKLINSWRGDYRETVAAVAALLDRSPRLADRAADMLKDWGPVAAPAAETVARRLAALDAMPWRDGLPEWTVRYSQDVPGLHPYVETLAGIGDDRALPMLLTALDLPQRPRGIGAKLARYPQHAERITAEIVHRLPTVDGKDLQFALRAYGAAAAPAVPLLLAAPLDEASATTLGRIGPAAAEALPALRTAAAGADPRLAVAAAGALWRIDRSADALAILTAHLDGPAATRAFEEIAEMGTDAAAAAALLATYLDQAIGDEHWWIRVRAGLALWRATGDTDRVAPVLTAAWHGNRRTRLTIAGAGISALRPLLRAERAEPRRATASDNGWSSSQVSEDEQLLARCR